MGKDFKYSTMKLDKNMSLTLTTSLMISTLKMGVSAWLQFLCICEWHNILPSKFYWLVHLLDAQIFSFSKVSSSIMVQLRCRRRGRDSVPCRQGEYQLCALVEGAIWLWKKRTFCETKDGWCSAFLEHEAWWHSRSIKFAWLVIIVNH